MTATPPTWWSPTNAASTTRPRCRSTSSGVTSWRSTYSAPVDANGELTLTFIDRGDIAELNAEHMGKSGPTDVLSFPMDDEPLDGVPTLLGDVVISPAVAADQFAEHAGTIDDELALLVVHGILHVLGHDHAEPHEAAVMRACELDLLERFHWHRPGAGRLPPDPRLRRHAASCGRARLRR